MERQAATDLVRFRSEPRRVRAGQRTLPRTEELRAQGRMLPKMLRCADVEPSDDARRSLKIPG